MINQALIEEVIISPLCIESKYLQAMTMAAYTAFTTGKPFGNSRYESAYAIDPSTNKKQTEDFTAGSVGIVTINGPIVSASDPWYGIKGTIEAAQELIMLDADPNLIGSVFVMESGGGAVYAIKPIVDVMATLSKPVVIFSKHILASAALRIACSADHIMMYHPHGIVGSLGTMSSSSDLQPMFEKWGIQFNEFYATESILKNKTSRDAKAGDGKALIESMLNPMNDKLLSDVKALRGHLIDSKTKSIFQGETYMADPQGLDLGLIDSVGNINDAIAMVVSLASGETESALTPNSENKMFGLQNFKKLSSLKGMELKAITPDLVKAANQELVDEKISGVTLVLDSELEQVTNNQADPAAATALTTANETIAGLRTELAAANLAKTNAEAALAIANTGKTTAEAALVTANAKIVELGGQAAAEHTGGQTTATEQIENTGATAKTYSEADAKLAEIRAGSGLKQKIAPPAKVNGKAKANFFPALAQK